MKKVSVFFAILAMTVAVFSPSRVKVSALETSGVCGENLSWAIDKSANLLIIGGEGKMDDFPASGAPWDPWCDSVRQILVEDGVTTIGSWAFSGFERVTRVFLPAHMEEIGENAFSHCAALTDITIPSGVTQIAGGTFYECTDLKHITLPETVTGIGSSAFERCKALENISFPDSLTGIGDYAFADCDSLREAVIPYGVTSIGEHAFEHCDSLTAVTLPVGLRVIEDETFYRCRSLARIAIPYTVREISWGGVFTECALQEIDYGGTNEQWTELISSDLLLQQDVQDAVLRPNVHMHEYGAWQIRKNAVCTETGEKYRVCEVCGEEDARLLPLLPHSFEGGVCTECGADDPAFVKKGYCGDLDWRLNTGTGVLVISGNGMMENGSPWYTYEDAVKTVVIKEGVTEIGDRAFRGCGNLTAVQIPRSVTAIGERAFANCHCLTEICLPSGVDEIGEYAFWGCENLMRTTVLNPDAEIQRAALGFYISGENNTENPVLTGYEDSTAQAYALQNGISFSALQKVSGDVGLDGAIDSSDLVLLRRHLLNEIGLTAFEQTFADTDGDGTITILDLIKLKKLISVML